MGPYRPTLWAIDLFAGLGGATIGLEAAGFTVLGAWETDEAARRQHLALCPRTLLYGNVAYCRLNADLVWASPPCQPFSTAGRRRGAADDRDGFPALFTALENMTRRRWLIIETVVGFLEMPEYSEGVTARLRTLYAHVTTDILNAADFGVPQERRRVIIVAGPRPLDFRPSPRARVAAATVVGGGRCDYLVAAGLNADGTPGHRVAPRAVLTEAAPTVTTRGTLQMVRPNPDGRGTYTRVRTITIEERARLQGLPAARGIYEARAVGNAVPPPLVAALARAVREYC